MPRSLSIIGLCFILLCTQGCKDSGKNSDVERARDALITYFRLLHDHQYNDALRYHGGGFERINNGAPDISPDDHIALLTYSCELFRCLEVRNILSQRQLSQKEFLFRVQFSNEDGTLFTRGPCCGATEQMQPTETAFDYHVDKTGSGFLVMDLPPYVP